jgi:DNA-binding CsgD family transcriptional regulator
LPLLVAAAYRDDELTRRHPLNELVPILVRESQAERITLRSLRDEDLRAWLAAAYALQPQDEQRLSDYVGRYSDGNPFYVGELLRTLEDDRIILDEGGRFRLGDLERSGVPTLLRQVLNLRLARVSETTRDLLAVAAVIGQRVSHVLWRQVGGVDDDALELAIEESIECGLLVGAPRQPELWFRHALIREVLYQEILPPRRQIWHRRIAEELLNATAPDPDEVAHHFRLAGDPRAVEWLIRAGDRAYRGAYALQTAARRFESALEIVGTRHDLQTVRGWLLIRLALVQRYDDAGRCVLLLNDAAEVAARIGDDAMAAMAVWVRGTMRFLAGENGLADAVAGDRALSALDDAHRERIRRELGGRQLDEIARAGGLVWWHGYHGRPADAFELADRIAGQFGASERSDIDRGICEAGRAFAFSLMGRVREARAAYHLARRLLEEHRYDFHVVTVTAFEHYLLDLPYFTTDLPERQRKAELLSRFAEQDLHKLVRIPPRVTISGHLLIDGRWDEFAGLLDAVRSAPRSFFIWNYAVPVLAAHARYTGRPERARDLLRLILPHGPETNVGETGVPLLSLEGLRLGGELALDAGDLDQAAAWIAAHDRWLAWSGFALGQAEGCLLRARHAWLSGDTATARARAAEALELASGPRQPVALIAARRFLAGLDLEQGCGEAAALHLGEALELADACAAPFERALVLLVMARLDRASGGFVDAREKLQSVIETCTRLDAQPSLAEARSLFAEIESASPAGLLSPRELEVLTLVADGLTDREVAGQLFISPRTVNQHLRSIYNKLGVNSRAAATRRALELDLLRVAR